MVLLHVHKALYFLGRMLLLHGLNPEGFILQMLNLHLFGVCQFSFYRPYSVPAHVGACLFFFVLSMYLIIIVLSSSLNECSYFLMPRGSAGTDLLNLAM